MQRIVVHLIIYFRIDGVLLWPPAWLAQVCHHCFRALLLPSRMMANFVRQLLRKENCTSKLFTEWRWGERLTEGLPNSLITVNDYLQFSKQHLELSNYRRLMLLWNSYYFFLITICCQLPNSLCLSCVVDGFCRHIINNKNAAFLKYGLELSKIRIHCFTHFISLLPLLFLPDKQQQQMPASSFSL